MNDLFNILISINKNISWPNVSMQYVMLFEVFKG